jgi:2-polyprenyl-3-methyl-5-hydroxy-6-metoxy-1,4-benzoquinol methylase
MMNGYVDVARQSVETASASLLQEFGSERLAESAYPVYTSGSALARWLGWSRLEHAQRLAGSTPRQAALDIGAGLGTMLPFLAKLCGHVDAVDLDPEVTAFMTHRMALPNVVTSGAIPEHGGPYDLVTVLDVLEHVPDQAALYQQLLSTTAMGGRWVISGPTENWLYRGLRRVSGTSGEGHLRNVYGVFDEVPPQMTRRQSVRLPFGSPVPLFVVASFDRTS